MEHASARTESGGLSGGNFPLRLEQDARWCLARRVVASRHFAKSHLLSNFLLFVVGETLEGRQGEISEHQIGVHVFARSPDYSTTEDNIVRNYARQLRKRLAEHFAEEGSAERIRIEIPVGGYVPVFTETRPEVPDSLRIAATPKLPGPVLPTEAHAEAQAAYPRSAPGRDFRRWPMGTAILTALGLGLVAVTWFATTSVRASRRSDEPTQALWASLIGGVANCFIVPADVGFNLVEDLSHRPLGLAEYLNGGYLNLPLDGVDPHSAQDLRSQQFTTFVDLQVVEAIARRPEFDPQRVVLRFPRDLRPNDLEDNNAVIIGSIGSNPWASIADDGANFRIVYRNDMEGATIVNSNPQPGEAASYASHWNEPAHETFALISFVPNLSRRGHLLFLEGLDVAGTQAAAQALLDQDVLAPIIRRATRPNGSLGAFEVLVRSTSIQSSAAGVQVVAFRMR